MKKKTLDKQIYVHIEGSRKLGRGMLWLVKAYNPGAQCIALQGALFAKEYWTIRD